MSRRIAEGSMKRQWQARRATLSHPDGQRRWDQADQHLLRWSLENETVEQCGLPPARNAKEVRHERAYGDLRPGLDGEPRSEERRVGEEGRFRGSPDH